MDKTAATTIADEIAAPSTDRAERLVELVAALAGCHTEVARNAVQRSIACGPPQSKDQALDVVARALVSVGHGIDLRDEPAPADRD